MRYDYNHSIPLPNISEKVFRYGFATQIPPKTRCLEAYRVYNIYIYASYT